LNDKKKAEVLFERGKSLFEKVGYIFSLRTTTNYFLEAIELDTNNKKYKEALCNLYDSYWKDSDFDNGIEALRLEYESGEYVGTKEEINNYDNYDWKWFLEKFEEAKCQTKNI